MSLSALWQSVSAAALAQNAVAGETSAPVVVVTGLSLVFGILILLYFILLIEGKIFASIDAKKREKPQSESSQKEAALPPAEKEVAQSQPAAAVAEEGVPPEVVAAIAAAVSQLEGGEIYPSFCEPCGRQPRPMGPCRCDQRHRAILREDRVYE
ncbi:OadG family protein [Ruminococcaceae bacterium OttesenSCG-928-I18]|nr:OadG family protein [Ruminococcaceae bacterium OttesenSCG-928-I18]